MTFEQTEDPMANYGYISYAVWRDGVRLGVVFPYHLNSSRTVRWVARRCDGTLRGIGGELLTRAAAAETLV